MGLVPSEREMDGSAVAMIELSRFSMNSAQATISGTIFCASLEAMILSSLQDSRNYVNMRTVAML